MDRTPRIKGHGNMRKKTYHVRTLLATTTYDLKTINSTNSDHKLYY